MASHLFPLRHHGPPAGFGNAEGDTLPIPWSEDITEEKPFNGSWSYGEQVTFTMRIWVDWDSRFEAMTYILGKHYRDAGAASGSELRRYPEWRCPHFGWLRASKITEFEPFYYRDHDDFVDAKEGYLSEWERLRLTVAFSTPRYAIYPDESTGNDESIRYVQRREEDYTEFVKFPAPMFYANGAHITSKVDASIGVQVPRKVIYLTWHRVPKNYIYTSATGKATKLESCQGRVNNNTFFDYPTGTLLCESPKIEEEPTPFWNMDGMGKAFNPFEAPVLYKVGITLKYFDPDPVDAAIRGWNLVMQKDSLLWALATHNGDPAGRRQYQYANFDDMFKAV